jgi:hypothetical protein
LSLYQSVLSRISVDTASEFANDTDVHSTPKSDDGYDRLIGDSVPFRGMINEVTTIAPSLRDSDRSCSFPLPFPFHLRAQYLVTSPDASASSSLRWLLLV